jgi:hypothetical protein
LKHVDEFTTKAKTKGASPWPTCILDTLNKFLNVLMHELPKKINPCHDVHQKIEMVPRTTSPSKVPYRLNQKELQKIQQSCLYINAKKKFVIFTI